MMLLTAFVAMWLTIYQFNIALAWLLLPWWITGCVSIAFEKVTLFFWQPLVICAGWSIRSVFMPWWVPPYRFAFPLDAGFAATFAICVYAQTQTISAYRNQPSRNGILYSAIRCGGLAGVLVGCMLGAWMLVCLIVDVGVANMRGIGVDWEVWAVPIGLPLAGAVFGAVLGIGVGLVCDVSLAIEGRNRRRHAAKSDDGRHRQRKL